MPSLEQRLSKIEEDVATAAARLGREEMAERLRSAGVSALNRDLTLVVAGETSRGKSSLLGALLGRPALLPVDADVTTNVFVLVRHGTPERASVVLDSGDRLEIPTGAVAAWASVAGNPFNAKGVRSVELSVDHPLLAGGLTIIDTPGVGGISAGHADMTMVALSAADALLFVKDARAPLSAPEAAFLSKASERIETVIICLTKTDLFELTWESVAREDRQFLGDHLPRFSRAPIVPVSARRAEVAEKLLQAGDEVAAADLRTRSGLDELTRLIDETVVRPGVALRQANRVRAVTSSLETLEREQDARAAAARGDQHHLKVLQAARVRSQEYQRSTSTWNTQLGDDLTRLRLEVLRTLNLGVEDIRTRFPAATLTTPEQGLAFAADLPEQLASLTARLNAILNDGVIAIANRLRESLGVEGITVAPVDASVELQTGRQPLAVPGATSTEESLRWGTALMGLTTPVILLVNGVTLLVVAPLAILAGATTGLRWWQEQRGRDLNAARQMWSAQLTDTLSDVKIRIPPEIELRMLEVRTAITAAVRVAVEARIADLKRQEEELRKLAEATERERAAAIKNSENVKKYLVDQRGRAQRLLADIQALPAERERSAASPTTTTLPARAARTAPEDT